MPDAFILVGLPGCGKSHYRFENLYDCTPISTDDTIEDISKFYGVTYNDAFRSLFPFAEKLMNRDFDCALNQDHNIVIDRTNMSRKSRRPFIERLKQKGYRITCIVFPTPDKDEWERRLNSRPGKSISKEIIESMMARFEFPQQDEGFDEIIVIEQEEFA